MPNWPYIDVPSPNWFPTVTGAMPGSRPEREFLSGTPASTETFQFDLLTPQQQQALTDMLTQLQGNTVAPYQGQLTADQNAAQNLSLTALEQAAMRLVSPEAGSERTSAATTLQDIMGRSAEGVFNPLTEEFKSQVIPELTRRFGGQSGFSSDRVAAETGAAGVLAREMAKAYENYQGTRLQAALGLAGLDTQNIQNILGVQQGAAAAREQEQAPLTAQYQEFLRQQEQRQASIDNILKALGIQTQENVVAVTPGTSGFLGGAVGGLGGIISGILGSRRGSGG